MTQAFNLSQLANGVNTNGQVNAASYLYNQVPVANGGTALSSAGAAGNMLLATSASAYASVTMPTFGFKNRIINGAMRIAQRATSATITAGSTILAGYSTVDRFYIYCTGANVTAAQVAGSGSTKSVLQITGAAGVTGVGIGQRIEQQNSYDMAGSTATLSVDLSNSLLTSVTWTAYYANTADSFGTLASPTRTQIATGTFTVNTTKTRYSVNIAIPAAATTGIEIVFTVGAQTSGTWVVDDIQLEPGSVATSFDYRPYGTELALCQRYYQKSYEVGTVPATATFANCVNTFGTAGAFTAGTIGAQAFFRVDMRSAATITIWDSAGNAGKVTANPYGSGVVTNNSASIVTSGSNQIQVERASGTACNGIIYHYAASAEL